MVMKIDYSKMYNDNAEVYARAQREFYSRHPDKSREKFYEFIGPDVAGKKILDAGCGFGHDMKVLKDKGADVYGVDAAENMIAIAQREHPDLQNLFVKSFDDTAFKDEIFDIVISRYALHYAEDLSKTFKEIHRVLKPGGTLVVLVANPLLAFVAKKERNYFSDEVVSIPLFDNKVTIFEPSRTFSDYINYGTLSRLDLLDWFESPGRENDPKENSFKEVVPDFLLMKFQKR
ncbi:MAG: methyltransferase domain-containing protein [bacterium]